MSKWLRRGDRVVVLTGNDKGKTGKVMRRQGDRVVIEGINMRKKHIRRSQENPQGQVLTFEAPIHVSNVCACNASGHRVSLKLRGGERERELVYLEGGKEVVYRSITGAK